ncbi:MAG: hypothetical protein KAT05_03410 [Spirochaetes bacterium]|nr:hypothetical protein [Spirochaetota bacterium]
MQISPLFLGILILNVFIYYLVNKLSGVGPIRGGALSGWISSFIGISVMVNDGEMPTFGIKESDFISIYGIIAIISILLVFVGKDDPSMYNKPIIGELLYYIPRIGIIMGVIVASISQIVV